MDKGGNLYGTIFGGGPSGVGTVFKLNTCEIVLQCRNEIVLHSFNGFDGGDPEAGLVRDREGNLYGTTTVGGSGNCYNTPGGILIGCGTVFCV